MSKYLALIRGINVGGNNIVKMDLLRKYLQDYGFKEVKTYIQSGNIILTTDSDVQSSISKKVEKCLEEKFDVKVQVVVLSKNQWKKIIESAPKSWGKDPTYRHNIFVILPPGKVSEVMQEIGEFDSKIDSFTPGDQVIYQSVLIEGYNKSNYSELAKKKIYKQMTIRNYNTATKLLEILNT